MSPRASGRSEPRPQLELGLLASREQGEHELLLREAAGGQDTLCHLLP